MPVDLVLVAVLDGLIFAPILVWYLVSEISSQHAHGVVLVLALSHAKVPCIVDRDWSVVHGQIDFLFVQSGSRLLDLW